MSSFVFGRFALELQTLWTRFALACTVFEYHAAAPLDILGSRPGPLPVPDAPAAEVEAPAARANQHGVAGGAGAPAEHQLVVPAEGRGEGEEEQAACVSGGYEEHAAGEDGADDPAVGYVLAVDDEAGTSLWLFDGPYTEDNLEFRRHLFIARNDRDGLYYLDCEGGENLVLPPRHGGADERHDVADAHLVLEVPRRHHQLWQRQLSEVGCKGKELVPQPTGRRGWLFSGLLDIFQPFSDEDLLNVGACYAAMNGYKGVRAPAWLPDDVRAIMEEELTAEAHLEE